MTIVVISMGVWSTISNQCAAQLDSDRQASGRAIEIVYQMTGDS
jgi:hypothetical protein